MKRIDSTRLWRMRRATASQNKETFHLNQSSLLSTVKQTWLQEWKAVSHIRLFTALAAATVFTVATVGVTLHHIAQTSAWNRVYANGSYVGMVPNDHHVVEAMQRLADGYRVQVEFSSVHTTVKSSYQWQSLTSLPTPAVAIELNGKPLVYTSTPAAAEQALSMVQFALTPKSLKNGEAHFVGHVSVKPVVVSVADILSAENAARFLTNPHQAVMAARADGPSALIGQIQTVADTITPATTFVTATTGNPPSESTPASALTLQTSPLLQVVVTQTIQKTSILPYSIQYISDSSMGAGSTSVVHAGQKGQALDTVEYEYVNGKLVSTRVVKHQVVRKAEAEVAKKGTNTGIAGGQWLWPVGYTDVTSPFGPRYLFGSYNFHPGVDIGCPIGTPVYATNNGTIEEAGWNSGGYGIWVRMSNGNGIESIYGHLSSVSVSPGQTVAKGQLLGYSGMTGIATGPHLHYEVRENGVAINPGPYM